MRSIGNKIFFPHRGKPPTCPDGYIPTKDPFVFELQRCSFSTYKIVEKGCCRKVKTLVCKLKYGTSNEECKNCEKFNIDNIQS